MLHATLGGGWRVTSVTSAKRNVTRTRRPRAGGFFVFQRIGGPAPETM